MRVVFDFVCSNTLHRRTMVRSIYVIKKIFIKPTLLYDLIENR